MEEILHSIRDIIASEAPGGDQAGEEKTMAEDNKEPEEILELTDVVEGDKAKGSDVLDEIDSALNADAEHNKPQATFSEDPVAKPEPENVEVTPPAKKKSKAAGLISEDTAEVSSATIKKMMQQASHHGKSLPVTRSGTTLEDLVIESLRPMLAEWLNDNLPTLVRNIVQKEIRHILPRDE